MKEAHGRSVLKALSWRVVATMATFLIVYFVTGKLVLSLGVGIAEVFLKLFLFYLHERAWAHVDWGQKNVEENV